MFGNLYDWKWVWHVLGSAGKCIHVWDDDDDDDKNDDDDVVVVVICLWMDACQVVRKDLTERSGSEDAAQIKWCCEVLDLGMGNESGCTAGRYTAFSS